MRGIEARTPDSLLLVRAREALAAGPLDAVTLMERVCALPSAPPTVAERLADALFGRHPGFARDGGGRWTLVVPIPDDNGVQATARVRTVRERRQEASGAIERDDVPLRDLSFAVVDVETTGTSPAQRDRVTEIAIVHVTGGEVRDLYETLVNPERSIPPAIVALTRITDEMVSRAPRFRDVAHDVVGRLRERVFVAHNVSFDWRFVSHEVQRAAGVSLVGEQLCTVRLARHLLPHLPRRNLDSVTHHFGIDIGARHRAAGDALATAHVLVRLLRLAEERGALTWRELDALLHRGRARTSRRRSAMPRGVDIDPTV
ncbi:MAG: 3'-5' exonuclease [Gemmatimonadaceae bacterium]|nr:3'-5' exonuclease [Gemmatimonadaceae bacterium]